MKKGRLDKFYPSFRGRNVSGCTLRLFLGAMRLK